MKGQVWRALRLRNEMQTHGLILFSSLFSSLFLPYICLQNNTIPFYMPPHTNHIHTLLTDGDISAAIKDLLATNIDTDSKNVVLQSSERHTHNEKLNHLGTIDRKDYLLERNKIVVALLAICDKTPLPKKALTNAPLKPDSHFIGRETELAEIRKRFEANEMLMLVNGEGGIGKTTLASKYWHDYEQDYTHLAYVFCEGDIRDDIRNKLALPLGIEVQQVGEEKLLSAIIETMAAYPKPCLLILDNANDSKHIIDFRDTFREIGWHILITSRCQKVLPKEQEIAIHHLPPAQAKALFLQHYTENTPDFDSLLDKLLLAVGYNTLCVEIFAKTLYEIAPFGETIESLLTNIQQKGMYLGEKSFEIHSNYTDHIHKEAANSDEILEILYDIARLNETEKTLLLRFALLPPENHEATFLVNLFTPENPFQFGQELIALAKKGWLTTNTKTYRLSPVIQRLLLDKEKIYIWNAATLIVDNVNKKLESNGVFLLIPLHEAQPYSLVAESLIENIKKDNFKIGLLAIYLGDYYMNIGYLNKAIELLEKAATIYQTIEEEYNYGVCLSRLGDIYLAQGNTTIVKEYRDKVVALHQKRYEANPTDERRKRNLAIAYEHLGDIYRIEKEYTSARDFYQKEVDLFESLCKDKPNDINYKNGLAIAYQKIGFIYQQTSDLDNALPFYQKYNQLEAEIYQINPTEYIKNELAVSYSLIGGIFYLKKAYQEAISFYEKYHQLSQKLVSANPMAIELLNGLANSYYALGTVYKAMNQLSVAKEHFMAAEKIWRELVKKVPDYVDFITNWKAVKRDLEELL